MAIIHIVLSPDGQDKIEVNGEPGTNCRVLSKPYLEAIGGKTVEDHETAEMHQAPRQTIGQTQTMSH